MCHTPRGEVEEEVGRHLNHLASWLPPDEDTLISHVDFLSPSHNRGNIVAVAAGNTISLLSASEDGSQLDVCGAIRVGDEFLHLRRWELAEERRENENRGGEILSDDDDNDQDQDEGNARLWLTFVTRGNFLLAAVSSPGRRHQGETTLMLFSIPLQKRVAPMMDVMQTACEIALSPFPAETPGNDDLRPLIFAAGGGYSSYSGRLHIIDPTTGEEINSLVLKYRAECTAPDFSERIIHDERGRRALLFCVGVHDEVLLLRVGLDGSNARILSRFRDPLGSSRNNIVFFDPTCRDDVLLDFPRVVSGNNDGHVWIVKHSAGAHGKDPISEVDPNESAFRYRRVHNRGIFDLHSLPTGRENKMVLLSRSTSDTVVSQIEICADDICKSTTAHLVCGWENELMSSLVPAAVRPTRVDATWVSRCGAVLVMAGEIAGRPGIYLFSLKV